MKHSSVILILLMLVLAACAPAPNEPAGNTGEPISSGMPNDPDEPVNSNTATAPQSDSYAPKPEDTSLTRGAAFIDSVELLTLESYPMQFMLSLEGSLPTPCNQLRIAVSPPDVENKINVDVYSVSNPDEICIQVIAPFAVNYSLGSFPSGLYSLWVNSVKIAEFQS